MAIKIDQELCIGCGACVATCADVFKLGASGKAEVISQDNVECATKAAAGCPVQAISVE